MRLTIQPAIVQRRKECSLTVLCILNGYSQQTYELISNKIRNEGLIYNGTDTQLGKAIQRGIQIIRQLGKTVPANYGIWHYSPGDAHDLSGKGIVSVSFRGNRKRKRNYHVVCYENGAIIDTNKTVYANWNAYAADLKSKGWKEPRIEKVYPA